MLSKLKDVFKEFVNKIKICIRRLCSMFKKETEKPLNGSAYGKTITNKELDEMLEIYNPSQIIARHTHNIINLKDKQLERVLELKNQKGLNQK